MKHVQRNIEVEKLYLETRIKDGLVDQENQFKM